MEIRITTLEFLHVAAYDSKSQQQKLQESKIIMKRILIVILLFNMSI